MNLIVYLLLGNVWNPLKRAYFTHQDGNTTRTFRRVFFMQKDSKNTGRIEVLTGFISLISCQIWILVQLNSNNKPWNNDFDILVSNNFESCWRPTTVCMFNEQRSEDDSSYSNMCIKADASPRRPSAYSLRCSSCGYRPMTLRAPDGNDGSIIPPLLRTVRQ